MESFSSDIIPSDGEEAFFVDLMPEEKELTSPIFDTVLTVLISEFNSRGTLKPIQHKEPLESNDSADDAEWLLLETIFYGDIFTDRKAINSIFQIYFFSEEANDEKLRDMLPHCRVTTQLSVTEKKEVLREALKRFLVLYDETSSHEEIHDSYQNLSSEGVFRKDPNGTRWGTQMVESFLLRDFLLYKKFLTIFEAVSEQAKKNGEDSSL